ncbi:MAG TPA: hypothetical protein VFT87_03330, partial [Candidatus Saccharimonadales bacterium]|nr:hypothetical protein [Candidatus Saccharimonadales bacterium]
MAIIPTLLLFMPWVMLRFVFSTPKTQGISYKESLPYLVPAAVLWVVALMVPNVPISPETETFSMHMTGGVVAAILFLYATKVYQWRFETKWQLWVGL